MVGFLVGKLLSKQHIKFHFMFELEKIYMMQKKRLITLAVLRKFLTCAICTIGLLALFSVHVPRVPKLPDPYKLPTQHETNFPKLNAEQELVQENAPPHVAKPPLSSRKICDMVAVARIINATLVIPELDKRSFWQDSSNFADVFDQVHFIKALANDIKVVEKLPRELLNAPRSVRHFRSWSGIDYYRNDIASIYKNFQVIRAAKSDSRLANNRLPVDIQKLRCRSCYEALRFSPRIETMGKLLVERMRTHGRYIALHLRYEKDMLAFSGCSHGLSTEEAGELAIIRQNTSHWKVKDINATEQRSKGACPLTPKEVGLFLSGLGFPSNTPIYVAAGEIYGGESRIAELRARYPILMNKEKLASIEELEPFVKHASQMAALDYIVSVESDVFIPTYSGNMARAVEGHRRYLGHRKTITPDRKALVRLFDKVEQGTMKEGKNLSYRIIEMHQKGRQGSPRKRKGPTSGTKGMERFRTEEAFYENPLPECLCQRASLHSNTSVIK